MSEGLILFLVGLAFAIPFSIFGNLLTPRFEEWLSKRSEKAALRLKGETSENYLRTKLYYLDPSRFTRFAFNKILDVLFSMFIIALGLCAMLLSSEFHGKVPRLTLILFSSGMGSTVIYYTIRLAQLKRSMNRLVYRLNKFTEYQQSVRELLGDNAFVELDKEEPA